MKDEKYILVMVALRIPTSKKLNKKNTNAKLIITRKTRVADNIISAKTERNSDENLLKNDAKKSTKNDAKNDAQKVGYKMIKNDAKIDPYKFILKYIIMLAMGGSKIIKNH
jgi:hypothetical protein